MNASVTIITQILSAGKLEDLVTRANWKEDYKKLMRQVHPDVCNLPDAALAAARLNILKEHFEKGTAFTDESGHFQTNGHQTTYTGNADLLRCSFHNYNLLRSIGSDHLLKYLPQQMHWQGARLVANHTHRAVPLSQQNLPQEHVNWILSRLLEFVALLYQHGYTHGGLNPESVFVVPETHGIQVTSFYHLTPINRKVATVNAHYKSWYPAFLFKEKRALPVIDIELSKKIAIYLLGDPSGHGIKLRKTHHPAFIDFVIAQSTDPVATYQQYRDLLSANFKKAFHILNL